MPSPGENTERHLQVLLRIMDIFLNHIQTFITQDSGNR